MEMTTNTHFEHLKKLSKKACILDSVSSLLGWDQETYMPKDSITYRSDQIELLASIAHKEKTNVEFSTALSKLIDLDSGKILDESLSFPQKAALREWRRDFIKEIKLPNSFVEEFAKITSSSLPIWSEAKNHSDFSKFSPNLKKIVELCKKKAELLGYKDHPYDALLDLYEPGMTTAVLTEVFTKLKLHLTDILRGIQSRPQVDTDFFKKEFSSHGQLSFSKKILKAIGFNDDYSRLDISAHPFCSAFNPKDVRMTTRIVPGKPMSCLFSVIHEAGHGIYEAQLDENNYGTPLGAAISLGIHESQSRIWETMIGHSYPFWQHFYPYFQAEFPTELSSVHLDEFFKAINKVEPSMVRVEADEVTYCLHVILRFEIEKMLIEGSLQVDELPKVWNRKMTEYLGITPKTDAEGCLQDIHWSMGAFGYFPTYALGNIYAAQIFEALQNEFPDLKAKIASGHLLFIREWLKDHLHKYGRQYTPQEMIVKISGKELSEQPYVDYLKQKFSKIYNF